MNDERDALMRDPYPRYAQAREAAGLTFAPELNAWLVARSDDVREVLGRPDDFSSAIALVPDVMPTAAVLMELAKGTGGGSTVITADGTAHQRLREPHTRGLSAGKVAAVVPFITERAEALVDSFAADGQVELMSRYAERLPGEVIGHLIGLDPQDVPAAIHGSRRAEELLFRPLDAQEQIRAAQDVVALQHLLAAYVADRGRNPRADLCTAIVQALSPGAGEPADALSGEPQGEPQGEPRGEPHGELTGEQRGELVSSLQNLLIAGHLTTTALIGTAVLHLLRHRPQWEMLCERPELIPGAVEEAARFDTALQGFRRITTRPVTLAGVDLPAGAHVFVAFGSANRDEATCDRPDEFDITRTRTPHLSFGFGVHGCPGARLAREQLRVTLETLTRRLPTLRLAPDQAVTMRPTMIHRSPQALFLTW